MWGDRTIKHKLVMISALSILTDIKLVHSKLLGNEVLWHMV